MIPAFEDAREYRPEISSVYLSTFFLPAPPDATSFSRALKTDHRALLRQYGTWPDVVWSKDLKLVESKAIREEILHATTLQVWSKWAGCSNQQVTSKSSGTPPLPCRTGSSPSTCFDGARRCGTLEENSRDPYVEFVLDFVQSGYYLFAIEFTLPDSPVYGPLLFKSYYETGGTGYTVTLTDDHRLPLSVECLPLSEQNVVFWIEGLRLVQHRCARVLASDEELEELSRVRHVKITLNGEHRQLWVDSVQLIFRRPIEVSYSIRVNLSSSQTELIRVGRKAYPSPPVQSPYLPPQPKAPPDAPFLSDVKNCSTFFGRYDVPQEATVLLHEPCGITIQDCCQHAHENGADGFQINGAGCCDLLVIESMKNVAHEQNSVNIGWVVGHVVVVV